MKKTLSLLVVAALLLALVPAPAIGVDDAVPSSPLSRSAPAEDPSRSDPPGELIIADVLFLRTAGLVACVIGAVGALVVWPLPPPAAVKTWFVGNSWSNLFVTPSSARWVRWTGRNQRTTPACKGSEGRG